MISKSKGTMIASAVALSLTLCACHEKNPEPGSAYMGPSHMKSGCGSKSQCKANKCKGHIKHKDGMSTYRE